MKHLVLRRPKKHTTIERSEYVGCGKRMLPYFGTCNLNIHMPHAPQARIIANCITKYKKGLFSQIVKRMSVERWSEIMINDGK